MTYDAADNTRKCYDLAIREIRLDKIRKGIAEPRPFHPEEMKAWKEGRMARRAIWTAMGGVFVLVSALAYVTQEIEPRGKSMAGIQVSKAGVK